MKIHLGTIILAASIASAAAGQSVVDSSLNVQTFASGFNEPTGMLFLNNGDALVSEKSTGKVQIVHNGTITGTALDLAVASDSERGLLSITPSPNFASDNLVYAYYTAAKSDGGSAIENRIVRFHWNGSKLVQDRRVIDLPATPGPNHMGGKIAFDANGRLMAVVGDANHSDRQNNDSATTYSQNGTVIRVFTNGAGDTNNPFYKQSRKGTSLAPLNDIYAYGIRNSFGLAMDPVSGGMWMSENGPDRYDEINRLTWGFNGGWNQLEGPLSRNPGKSTSNLQNLGVNAKYSDPKFSWANPIAPTDVDFATNVIGSQYNNDMFVGDINGKIYHFDLSTNRKSLILNGALSDGVADNSNSDPFAEQSSLIFGNDFGVITDIVNGPDGIYVTSLTLNAVFKIAFPGTVQNGLEMMDLSDATSASSLFANAGFSALAARNSGVSAGAVFVTVVPEPALAGLTLLSLIFLNRRPVRHLDDAARRQ